MSRSTDRRGFTLVEVVLAMAIVAMVVAAVFAVLRLAHRAERKGTARSEESQRVLVLADRLNWLLAGAFPFSRYDAAAEKDRISFEGNSDSVSFVTTSVERYSDEPEDQAGLKYVRLGLGPEGLTVGQRIFYMDDAEVEEYVLEPNVTELEIEYMEQDRTSGETDWVSDWDPLSREYIPLAVSVKLSLVIEGRRLEIPPVIVRLPAGGSRGVPVPLPKLP